MRVLFRKIRKEDNKELAELIRRVFREFKINRPGTVYTDPTTDDLYSVFLYPKSDYWIAEYNNRIIGGCGVYPTDGLPEGCAELVKFYLLPEARGKGIGRQLMEMSFESSKQLGFKQIYLESFPELGKAVGMYEKAGFKALEKQIGNSGHYATTIWMIKDL